MKKKRKKHEPLPQGVLDLLLPNRAHVEAQQLEEGGNDPNPPEPLVDLIRLEEAPITADIADEDDTDEDIGLEDIVN